ncbi:unnamed protein product, partial [Durusdinium trenchii]
QRMEQDMQPHCDWRNLKTIGSWVPSIWIEEGGHHFSKYESTSLQLGQARDWWDAQLSGDAAQR